MLVESGLDEPLCGGKGGAVGVSRLEDKKEGPRVVQAGELFGAYSPSLHGVLSRPGKHHGGDAEGAITVNGVVHEVTGEDQRLQVLHLRFIRGEGRPVTLADEAQSAYRGLDVYDP
jgi:hypothetical protein